MQRPNSTADVRIGSGLSEHHRRRPLKVGLMVPHAEGQLDGRIPRWTDIVGLARRAEEVGFDSVWMPDHLLYRFPGGPQAGVWECWSVLAALAAATTRVALGALVGCTGYRNPALLAKMADTVDEVSGGRLILGLGAGWHEPDYRAFGYPFDHRFARFDEAFTIIRTLLREGYIDFTGTYYQARECELRPRGPRPSGPPLLVGTLGERMLRLTAAHADAWNIWLSHCPSGLDSVRAAVDAACLAVGRDPATLERTVGLVADPGGRGVPPLFRTGDGPVLTGSPTQMADALRHYAREGVAHVQLWIVPSTLAAIEAFAPVLDFLDRG